MQGDPCKECGETDLKLLDGFYYCVECGTQNTNVRETLVEAKTLGDGTFAISTKKKIIKLQDRKVQMSDEWYKWHAFNFIIQGLADELVAVGAKPTFKMKLLWIWTRYIKKYQNKEKLVLSKKSQDRNNANATLFSFMAEDEENSTCNPTPDDDENGSETEEANKKKITRTDNVIVDGSKRDISFLSKNVIIAMLYLALNLDECDIQLSHLYRFIKEKNINISKLQRFVPEEIDLKNVQLWSNFVHCKLGSMHQIRTLAMSLLRKLDLGTPKVPDLRTIVDNIMIELCLPNDIKPLIYSLMYFHRCDFLDMNKKSKESLVRLPDYEGIVMSYILVALKMCFGLDGYYEEKLSDAVEKINEDRDLSKSHRIGKYSEPSSRLFSFRKWCSYVQFRKVMLCKYCLNMAELHSLDIDDYVYMEHLGEMPQNNKELQDETAIDLISKIPEENDRRVIPKHLFLPSLTPLSEYTDIIIEHSQDQEMRSLLSEDFTQYSLKYACEYLHLRDANTENIIKGVSENGKTVTKVIIGTLNIKKAKPEMVYVKNCENRNWLKTKPPTIEHVTCDDLQNESNDKESDHGYDSENTTNNKEANIFESLDDTDQIIKGNDATENTVDGSDQNIKSNNSTEKISDETEQNLNVNGASENIVDDNDQNMKADNASKNIVDDTDQFKKEDKKHLIIVEEDFDKKIFDDSFEELDLKDEMEHKDVEDFDVNNEDQQNIPYNESLNDDRASISDMSDNGFDIPFNADTFDREQTIKELILRACKKYKITVPPEYKTREPRKRKSDLLSNEAGSSEPRKRTKKQNGENKRKIQEIVSEYYNILQNDVFHKMQQEVNLAIQNTQLGSVLNITQNDTENQSNKDQANVSLSEAFERSSILTENVENQWTNPQNSMIEQNDNINNENPEIVEEIDENLEKELFEGEEEMKLDDLIPKGDPKFDEEKYHTDQLYIKMKIEEEIPDIEVDPKLEEILSKKIDECRSGTGFEKQRAELILNASKTKYESDSDDEIPLNVLQEEKKKIEEMMSREDDFKPLINEESVKEFKYWFRLYETEFMLRSVDWHKKFDEELKENTPTSFCFVIKECASILNCTTFSLYKYMQSLEQYIIARAKNPVK